MVEDEIIWDLEEKYFEEGNIDERPKKLKEKIFEWCQKGDAMHLKKYINDTSLNISEPDNSTWTPIQWAIVNNHVPIVKIILEKLHSKRKQLDPNNENEEDQDDEVDIPDRVKNVFGIGIVNSDNNNTESEINYDNVFKKPITTSNKKYTPLHWSAYKGNVLITSILLKYKYDPLEVDMYGNTALHQAAASNHVETFKLFMGLGIDLGIKNARNHTPLDLTSSNYIKHLIKKSIEITRCQICDTFFTFFVRKYLCFIKEEVICRDCCNSDYFFGNEKSELMEILQCRCKNCIHEIKEEENKMQSLIDKESLDLLQEHYKQVKDKNIIINPKLRVKAIAVIDRLQRERDIKFKINSLEKVDDHKTIEKSVFMLLQDLEDAKNKGVNIDQTLVSEIINQRDRKIAEKELRKLLSNVTVYDSSDMLKMELEERFKKAKETGVDQCFLDHANNLLEKVCLHLNYLSCYHKLVTYPPREYKPKDPNDKKKKKVEPPKKKKKKEAPFPTPDWAVTSKEVKEKIDEYNKYLKMGSEIGLGDDHQLKSKEILARFKLELEHRRGEEEELRLLEEERLKKNEEKGR